LNKKEAVYMKKFIPILAAMGLVLAVGVAYADDMRSIVQDDGITYTALAENGVTFLGSVSAGIQCVGAAAGGMISEPKDLRSVVQDDGFTYIAPDNSVTFAAAPLGPKCSWARGLGSEMELHNDVTIPGGNQ
jgi:hypothetical protein